MAMSDQAIAGGPAPPSPRWWLAWRDPAPVDLFRAVVAVGLMVHFAMHLRETAPLLAGAGLYDPGVYGYAVRPWLLVGLPPVALECVFAAAVLLAALTGIGVAPRRTALVLFAISVATYRAIFPIADEGDFFANATALSLALMPAGGTLTSLGRGGRAKPRVPGLAVTIVLIAVAGYYLSGQVAAGSDVGAARQAAAIARFIPIAFVLPLPALRWVGVAAQILVHGYLAATTHAILANVVLAATALLFWGEASAETRGWTIDAGGALCVVLLVLLVMGAVAPLWAARPSVAPTQRVLADLGLLRPEPEPLLGPPRSVTVVGTGSGRRELLEGGRRWQSVVDHIAHEDCPARLALAASAARRYCQEKGYWGFVGTLVSSAEGSDHRVFDFECGTGGELSRIR
jgi:hypothetical protein